MTGKKGMTGSGGARKGAGRKLVYGEPVKRLMVQVPASKVEEFKKMVADWLNKYKAP